VVIRNDGEIAGHVLLSAGDDRIGGTGTWSGGVSTGDGNDVFVHRGDTPVAGVRLQAGDDVFRADTSAAVEVTGNTGDDRLIGGSEDDVLFGGAGRDVLAGRGGDDALFGGSDGDVLGGGTGEDVLASRSGADRLRGEEGDDTLFGGAGADRLDGGPGEDVLVGGAGGDTFLFPTDPGVDRVEDFAPGVDRIALGASADDVSVEFTEEGALVRSGTSGLLLVGTFEDPLLG
jgi:Ca2+-binding RTX toxin-like protein